MQKKHKAKKSLGQNFLKSAEVIKKIVEAGEILPDDFVLEIGPGKGALTEKILEKIESGKLIAIEKDDELFNFLKEKFQNEIEQKKLILENEDILVFSEQKFVQKKLSKYKIIANIPYNITGAILKKFLTGEKQPERMILMLQKEVVERIIARDKKESLLSISVKVYGSPKIITKVPSRYFSPQPRVDSAVISITNISKDIFQKNDIKEELFWEILHAGFAHKRKKLSSNLKNLAPKDILDSLKNKRAEELTLNDWISIVKVI